MFSEKESCSYMKDELGKVPEGAAYISQAREDMN